MLERQREYHPSFVLMGGGFVRSLLPWGRPIPNGERVAELDDGGELPLSECFRRSWEEGKHLFMTGPGGVGKTVALLTFATEKKFLPRKTAAVYMPLYDLSQYADERRDCVDEYLGKTFSKGQLGAIDALSRDEWDGGPNLILLMDGYNEIPPERRRHVEAGVRKWAERPGVQVVTTSRVPGLVGLARTTRVGLRGLAEDGVADYLSTRNPDVAVPEKGTPLARLLETPLMLRLYVGVEEYRQRVGDDGVQFRDSRTAGDLVWNYLQAELHACMGHRGRYSERGYVEAILLTLPYVCWRMESAHEFKVGREKLRQYVDDAAARWEGKDKPEYVVVADGGSSPSEREQSGGDIARAHLSILEGVSGLVAKRAGGDYSLAHQSLRDGLAAIHLLNVATAPREGLPAEFGRPLSEYVKDYSVELLSENRFLALWEANRKSRPTNAVATDNLLRVTHEMKGGDLAQLDWSGMDLRGMSLFPFRRGLRLELSRDPERFDGTRLDVGCFKPQGHSGSVTSVCFSPDGSLLASGSDDGTVRLWDAATGRQVAVLEGHGSGIRSVCFSPDGSHLISCSGDGTVQQWNVALGYQSSNLLLRHERGISSICFSPDGTLMAIGHYDGAVSLRTASSGWQSGIMLKGHQSGIESVSFSPDGALVASGSRDGTVRLWSATTYRQVGQPIDGQGGVVFSICFSLDGTSLATGSLDGFLRLWDVASGQLIGQLPGNHGAVVRSVSFSPDGTLLVGGYSDGTVRLWDVLSRQQVGRSLDEHGDKVYSVYFSPDGTLVASGHSDGMVRFWDAATGRQVGQPLGGHRARVRCICQSPDGTIVVSGATNGTVSVLDAKSGRRVGKQPTGHKYAVASVCFSPDGKLVASGSYDRTVRLWDVATGRQVCQPLVGHGGQILSACFSPDGKLVASGSWDRTIRLWDVVTGKQVAILPSGREFPITSVCFSPNGALVAGGSLDRTVRLWDVATGQKVGSPLEPRRGGINSICFSPNGMLAVGCIDGSVQLWDTASEQQVGIGDKIDGPVESLAFSSRGLHAVHLEGGFAGITTIKPSLLRHPALLCMDRILHGMKRIGLFIVLPLLIVFLLIDSALWVLSNDRASIRNLRTRVTNGAELLFHDSDPLNHKDGNHIAGSYVTIAPLYDIDISGLDLTRARIDKRTKKILRKNDVKA